MRLRYRGNRGELGMITNKKQNHSRSALSTTRYLVNRKEKEQAQHQLYILQRCDQLSNLNKFLCKVNIRIAVKVTTTIVITATDLTTILQ